MSKFRRKRGADGSREERQRSRERAREARRRREELERRAAKAASEPAPEQHKKAESKPAAEKDLRPKVVKSEAPAPKKVEPKRGRARKLPSELSRRLSLPALWRRLSFIVRFARRIWRLGAFLLFWLTARVERGLGFLIGLVKAPTRAVVGLLGRTVTPHRMAFALVVVSAIAVLASQAIDYRAVAIGEAAYAEVSSLAQAPLTGQETPWVAHGPLVALLGLIAAAGALAGLRADRSERASSRHSGQSSSGTSSRGWRPRQIALAAAAAGVLVIVGIDLPRAGDLDEASAEYAGTGGVLLKGFYIQLVAMALLAYAALLPTLWRLSLKPQGLMIKRPPMRATERKSAA